MDLKVHRAMMLIAAQRVDKRLNGQNKAIDLNQAWKAMWLGNWLTDMSQATCFFDLLQSERKDPYKVIANNGTYTPPAAVVNHENEWTGLFQGLWKHECESSGLMLLGAGAAAPKGPNDIGGYHPYAHFDVVDLVDDKGDFVSREPEEFAFAAQTRMTKTAYEGIFKFALEFYLKPAFSYRNDPTFGTFALKNLGRGLHVLQDFYAHSNFVELLLDIAAKRGFLDDGLTDVLQKERAGTFSSYFQKNSMNPEETPVMTGRFDRIDTVAVLLKIYRNALVPYWRDLAASGTDSGKTDKRDLIFEAMFGTFSNNPFVPGALRKAKVIWDGIDAVKDAVKRGAIWLFEHVAKLFAKNDATCKLITDVSGLLEAIDMNEARNFAKAGQILYLEHVIEQKLRDDLQHATDYVLPHHTLLAKDNDVANPEVRLAYKLGCFLATRVTEEVMAHFVAGADVSSIVPVLEKYYRHPREILSATDADKQVSALTTQFYGERWWHVAETHDSQVVIV